ncbi:MAG: putative rane protein [Blastocatellia bacterium]|nr:putative rane protein [Blastocatellia bacterium]
MSRIKFDHAAGEELAQAVRDIEHDTDAEIVIVVRGRSGTYRHADYLCGAIVALAGLIFVLFSPFEFHTYWVPFDVLVLFVAATFVSSRTDAVRRALTSKKFRANAARTGAAAMFYEAGIANTSAENGLLIYLSLLERRLEVIADRGILKAVPALQWNNSVFEIKRVGREPEPEKLIKAVRDLGRLLAEHMPATGENPNELPDGPRIELK